MACTWCCAHPSLPHPIPFSLAAAAQRQCDARESKSEVWVAKVWTVLPTNDCFASRIVKSCGLKWTLGPASHVSFQLGRRCDTSWCPRARSPKNWTLVATFFVFWWWHEEQSLRSQMVCCLSFQMFATVCAKTDGSAAIVSGEVYHPLCYFNVCG